MTNSSTGAGARSLPSPEDINNPLLRHTLDAVPTGLVIVDPSRKIVFVNAAAERMFLYHRGECQGQTIEALVPAAFRAEHAARADAFLLAPSHRAMGRGQELRALRKDGTEFPVEIGMSGLPTSEGGWGMVSVVDITERKNMETKAREHHEHVLAYLEAASEGLITVNESGVIEMVNQATERIFGYTRPELLGQPLECIVPEAHRHLHVLARQQYFAEPRLRSMGAGRAFSGRRKDGTLFPAEVGLNVARIGGRTSVIAFVTDITEKRRLEEQSSALGTLVDLQQQLSSRSRRESPTDEFDPLTGLDTRTQFEQALGNIASPPQGLYVIVYSIRRLQQMKSRFGQAVTDRIVVFVGQYVANSLCGKGDRLFGWDGKTLVALLERDSAATKVEREAAEICGNKLEYFLEQAAGSAFVKIALQAKVLPLSGLGVSDVVSEIERVQWAESGE